MSQKIATMPL